MTQPATTSPLIEPADLAARLGDDGWRVVDCRFKLLDPPAGRRAYAQSHVPGAVYADLEHDLSRPAHAAEGRHPLPSADALGTTLERLGISNDTAVVAYDDASGAIAARLWWLLRWVGHTRVAVLDGGLTAWTAAGLPLEAGEVGPRLGRFTPAPPPEDRIATTAEIAAAVPDGLTLLDARSPERFAGRHEPIDPIAGHVPGSTNLPFDALLGADGRFLPRDALEARFRGALGPAPTEPIVAMCGSGVTACHLLLGLQAAGLPPGRLYAGSWSEWIRDPQRPVATGD